MTHSALLADILALLILIRSWWAWHSELVTRACRALVAGRAKIVLKLIQPHAFTVGILARRGISAFADGFGSATCVHVGATGARDHVKGVFGAVMTSCAGDLIVPVRFVSSLFNVDHAVVATTLIAGLFVG